MQLIKTQLINNTLHCITAPWAYAWCTLSLWPLSLAFRPRPHKDLQTSWYLSDLVLKGSWSLSTLLVVMVLYLSGNWRRHRCCYKEGLSGNEAADDDWWVARGLSGNEAADVELQGASVAMRQLMLSYKGPLWQWGSWWWVARGLSGNEAEDDELQVGLSGNEAVDDEL